MRLPAWLHAFAYPPWPLLLSLAATGLAVSAWTASGPMPLAVFCAGGFVPPPSAEGWASAAWLAMTLNPPARLLGDWMLMLLAMTPPLLATPLMHVWRSSLPRRRLGALVAFVAAYVAVWLAAAPALILAAILLLSTLGAGGGLLAALAVAGVWSAGPWQRKALNFSHLPRRIGLFGWAPWRDSAAFGVVHAGWCVASCWTWMVLPLTAGRWHVAAMALAGLIMLVERLAPAGPARWRAPWPAAMALRWSPLRG
jgi:predicted metal-binding membrane protein